MVTTKTFRLLILPLIILLTAAITSIQAQVFITGEVANEQGTPLPTANILLLDAADSTMVKGGITNEKGRFTIKNISRGTYLVSVSMVGFQKHHTDHFEVSGQPVDMGTIVMRKTVQQMDQVSVEARKPLFEQEIDRLVVNVQRSITSAGSSVLEVLEKSPGVQVNRQSNSLSLNGKSGVRVLINGKIQRMPIDAVVQMLNGMNASNVEEIELISNPPAKYEAEGTGGLINIKMKQYATAGYQGTVGTEAGYNWAETLGGNLNFRYRDQKLAFFINYSINYDHNQNFWINEQAKFFDDFTQVSESTNRRRYTINIQNIRTGLEYDIGGNTTAGVLLGGYRRLWNTDDVIDVFSRPNPNGSLSTEMDVDERNDWKSALINTSLDHTLSKNHTLSFDLDYLYYENNNPSSYLNQFIEGNQQLLDTRGIDSKKNTPINIWVSKLDYQKQISDMLTIEAGAKGTLSSFVNDVDVSEKVGDSWVRQSRFSSEADLSEKIGAAYISAQWQPQETWQLRGGLRFEYTDTYLSTAEQQGIVDYRKGHLFPSLHIRKNLAERKNVGLSYNRRITRPSYSALAPYVFFNGPNTFYSGNPSLQPAISDGISIDYQQDNWIVSLEYSYTNNEISSFQPNSINNSNDVIYRTENLDHLKTYGARIAFPLSLADWWQLQSNFSVRYQTLKSGRMTDNLTRNLASYTGNITSTWNLPRDLTFEATGFYRSNSASGVAESLPMGYVTAGLQKKVFDGQGTLRLAMNDIFHTAVYRRDTELPSQNLNSYMKYDSNVQSINLTFSYNFGNSDIGDVDVESGSSEEQGRVNTN